MRGRERGENVKGHLLCQSHRVGKLIHARKFKPRDKSAQGATGGRWISVTHEEKLWRDQLTEAVLALETKLARFQGER